MSAVAQLEKFGQGAKGAAIGVAVLAGLALGIYLWRKGPGGVARDVAGAAGQVAGGTVIGAVKGVSEGVGIQDTDDAACRQALAEGRMWDASFVCPAKKFLSGLFGGGGTTTPPAPTQKLIDNAQADTGAELRGL